MGVRIRSRNGILHLIYRVGGKVYEETTGLRESDVPEQNREVLRLAEVLRSRKEVELARLYNGLPTSEGNMSLYEYAERFARRPGASAAIRKALPYLSDFGGRLIKITAVSPSWYEDFQERMRMDSGLSAHTQEKYCCVVRQVLRKAARDGLLPRDPAQGIRHIPVPDSRKEYLTAEEVRRMAVTPYERPGCMSPSLQEEIRRAFLFGCCTGFRISDLTRLSWDDIDITRMEIVKRQKKTGKLVAVPLRKDVLALIDTGSREGLVFPELASTRTTTNRYLHGWAEASGIRKSVTWHTARHTDATLLVESGADLYTVMRLLGHTRIATTMQYAVVSDRKKREAVRNFPDVL
jgi:integrase